MLITNQTNQDYWFGPMHLPGGIGQTLTLDDTSQLSLYLNNDAVADTVNNLYIAGKITVSGQAQPFPRPTGVPQLLHGDGSPEGAVRAPQGSLYMRRDGTGPNSLYVKTTGVTIDTGWMLFNTGSQGTTYRKTTAKAVTNTTAETDLLNGEIAIASNLLGTSGQARITLAGDCLFNTGANNTVPRFRLKLGAGATTVLDTGTNTGVTGAGAGPTRYAWLATVTIQNLGATNAQYVTLDLQLDGNLDNNGPLYNGYAVGSGKTITWANTSGGRFTSLGWGASAIDTTVAMPIAFTVQNGVANANYDVTLKRALVEII